MKKENIGKENMNIRRLLLKIGISSNVQGFNYILTAVNILKEQKIHIKITNIYETLGKKYGKAPSAVERSTRNAINTAYKGSNILKNIYPSIPDNSCFLYDLALNFDIFIDEIERQK